jgi:DNA-binding transcriptional ArsR family regulator
MSNEVKSTKLPKIFDEDEIFKSLGHQIRRDIIRFVGDDGELTFTEIKNKLDSIDSPSLSYHLKSLQPLLKSKENKYKLSDIGISAYNLLQKTDQSHKLSRYKKRFIYAYISTVVCWIFVQTFVPFILYSSYPAWEVPIHYYFIHIMLAVVAVINYLFILKLRKV